MAMTVALTTEGKKIVFLRYLGIRNVPHIQANNNNNRKQNEN